MRVHDVTDRFGREQFEVFDKRSRRRGRSAGIDHENVATANDDDVIATGDHRAGGCGVVDTVGNSLELICLARSDWGGSLEEDDECQCDHDDSLLSNIAA